MGAVGVVLFAQYFTVEPSTLLLQEGLGRRRQSTYQPEKTPISESPTEAMPLESAPTPAALLLPALNPLPTPTLPFTLHTIHEGETLISIAAKYGITTEALLIANDIRDPTALEAGQPLLIPPAEGLRIPIILHQIKPSDDLLSIASLYGSSVKDILAVNPAIDPEALPVDRAVVVPIIFNQPKSIPRPVDSDEPVYYTVQSGDIPLTIAAEFDVPAEILLATNGITDPTRLGVGQQLLIPAYEGESFSFPVVLHELEEGDSLLDLAVLYGSSVKDILAVNPDLIPSVLEPGQVVAIPIIFRQPRPTPAPNEAPRIAQEASDPLLALQQEMLAAINTERQANGLHPYQNDSELVDVAVEHAQDMVVREYLAHITPEGKTVRDRIEEGGITDTYRVGENIQVNTKPAGRTVQEALRWFMSSRPHRRNLLHEHYNRIGIGIVRGSNGWHTFVLVFAQR